MLGRNEADYDLSGNDNLQKTWIDLLHPDDREKAANQFSDYLEGGSTGMYESTFRMKHKEGYWVWIWSRARTLRNEDHSITTKTIGTHIDISKQKKTEESQKQLIHEVGERMKELNCLYEIYKITDAKESSINFFRCSKENMYFLSEFTPIAIISSSNKVTPLIIMS